MLYCSYLNFQFWYYKMNAYRWQHSLRWVGDVLEGWEVVGWWGWNAADGWRGVAADAAVIGVVALSALDQFPHVQSQEWNRCDGHSVDQDTMDYMPDKSLVTTGAISIHIICNLLIIMIVIVVIKTAVIIVHYHCYHHYYILQLLPHPPPPFLLLLLLLLLPVLLL